MLLMRGRPSNLKTMAESANSVGCSMPSTTTASMPLGTDLKKTVLSSPVGGNNNKTKVNFKSQSPSDDSSIRYGVLPCETDHMYAHHKSENAKYRELADEVTHLKAMILFHLDLIQQQSEANAAKDKQISALRQENEMLKQRLERMERRVQLQSFKQKGDQAANDVNTAANRNTESRVRQSSSVACGKTDCPLPVDNTAAVNARVPDPYPNNTVVDDHSGSDGEPHKKRVKTLLPQQEVPISAFRKRPITRSANPEPEDVTNPTKVKASSPTSNLLDDLINQAVQEGAIINVSDTILPDDKIFEARVVLEPCIIPVHLTNENKVEGRKGGNETQKSETIDDEKPIDSPLTFPIEPEHKRIQEILAQKSALREPANMKKETLLIVEDPYITHVGELHGPQESMNTNSTHQAHVEVPRWIVKPLTGRPSPQGVEILEDEVFMKRHQKHELDEKRRKRWDLQRIREQRRYEKLRARYEGEDRSQDRGKSKAPSNRGGAFQNGTTAMTSFWSCPEDVTHIQVEPWLPVNVFGAPLPNIARTDFSLPWKVTRDPSIESGATAKRRQRRCHKAE